MYQKGTFPKQINKDSFDPFIQKFITEEKKVAHFFPLSFRKLLKDNVAILTDTQRMALEITFDLPSDETNASLGWKKGKDKDNAQVQNLESDAIRKLRVLIKISY